MLQKMENDYNRIIDYWWIYLISICIVGLIIRLYFLPWNIPPIHDGIDYFGYALEIKNTGELPKNWPIANNGWPSFLGVLFSIFPLETFFDFVNFIRISTVVISVITIIPIYFLCTKFFGRYLGLFGASLFAFEPKIIINSTVGGIEPLYILVGTLIFLMFFYRNYKTLVIAFALVAIISHLRYDAFILIIPVTILYFLISEKKIKHLARYLLCISIFLLILVPFLTINYYNTGVDGLFSHLSVAIIESQNQFIEGDFSGDVFKADSVEGDQSTYYILKGIQNLIKFLGISFFPVFILLIPFGIFAIFRKRNFENNTIIIFSSFLILPAFYAYVSGFNDIRYLFILYPIFCFISLFTLEKISNLVKRPTIFFIAIILILIPIALFSNFEYKDEIEHSMESFIVAQKVVGIASAYNEYAPESKYIKAAELENRWPKGSIATQSGHIVKKTILFVYGNNKTLEEFIQNSRDITIQNITTHPYHQFWFTNSSETYLLDPLYYLSDGTKKEMPIGLSHLVVDDRKDRPEFIQDIYHNEEKYPYLVKKFDSKNFGLKYNVKIFEINYERFDERDK